MPKFIELILYKTERGNMQKFFRTELLIGKKNLDILQKSHVAVFGVGGVGSFVVEALARSGVGKLTLVDFDEIDITNINRQIPATTSTIGKSKVKVMQERAKEINENIIINAIEKKYTPENSDEFFVDKYDFVVDAIDIITSKIHLIKKCKDENIKIVSSMGMGNKIAPEKIQISKLAKTHMDPLAKVMRRELKQRGIIDLDVIFSTEKPRKPYVSISTESKREIPASCAFVPPVAGLMAASFVIRNLIEEKI